VATPGTRVTFTFQDSNFREVKTDLYFPSTVVTPNDTAVVSVATLLQACSGASLTRVAISQADSQTGTPAAGQYASCQDKCLLEMNNDAGQASNWKLPAPIGGMSGIFLSDSSTLNPAATAVAAFVTAVISYVTTQGGTAFTSSAIAGHRLMRKRLKY